MFGARIKAVRRLKALTPKSKDVLDPITLLSEGRWQDSPPYVRFTVSMKWDWLHAVSCFRLSAHFEQVASMKWAMPGPPRAEHACGIAVLPEPVVLEMSCTW
jgi:hypothetical protein